MSSMNEGDCFLLNTDGKIYVYVDRDAKRYEKLKAISVANQIRDQDHKRRAEIIIFGETSR